MIKQRIFTTFLGISIAVLTFGQTNLTDLKRVNGQWTKTGEQIPFSGEFIENFDSGKIKGKGQFKDGLLEGLRIIYFENGNKKVESNYFAGQNHGKSTEYYSNGQIKQEGEYFLGKEVGTWKLYFENGNIHVIFNFSDGVQQGDHFEYTEDGELVVQCYFTNGESGYSPEFMELSDKAVDLGRQGNDEEAIKLYNKIIEINPTVAQAYFNRGTYKSNLFDFAGAIVDFDKAIKLKPDYMEAYANRGNAKINLYTSKGTLDPTPEQTESACDDFHVSVSLGDKTISTKDMIYLYCKKNKKKK